MHRACPPPAGHTVISLLSATVTARMGFPSLVSDRDLFVKRAVERDGRWADLTWYDTDRYKSDSGSYSLSESFRLFRSILGVAQEALRTDSFRLPGVAVERLLTLRCDAADVVATASSGSSPALVPSGNSPSGPTTSPKTSQLIIPFNRQPKKHL